MKAYWLLPLTLFFYPAVAQVPVDKELHHKVIFKNKSLRLIDLKIDAGDTTTLHAHAAASVIVPLSKSRYGIQVAGEKSMIIDEQPGDIRYAAYDQKPVTHRVWNQSASLFHLLVVEILSHYPPGEACPARTESFVKIKLQQEAVRVYSIDVAISGRYRLSGSACSYLLLNVNGILTIAQKDEERMLNPEDFVAIPPQTGFEISGNERGQAKCFLVELK